MVYDSNTLISSFTYCMSLSEMIAILSSILPNIVCYLYNFEEITGYPDYMGNFYKLRDSRRKANRSWENIPVPTVSYLDMVSAFADNQTLLLTSDTDTFQDLNTRYIASHFVQ